MGPRDLEFQTAEVVYPNPAQAQQKLPRASGGEVDISSMNRLIWGDCLLAMQALLSQGYEGKMDLIYIDPPFDSKSDYSHRMTIEGSEVTKEPSVIERLAYSDTWAGGIDSYLDMLFPRLRLMRRLLSDHGSIYVHIGPGISSYVKVLCDEVFGRTAFLNEIVWKRTSAHNDPRRYGNIDDRILFYSGSDSWIWNDPVAKYEDWYVERYYRYKDPDGRRWASGDVAAAGPGPARYFRGELRSPPPGSHWRFSQEKLDEYVASGRIYFTPNGFPRAKRYLDEMEGGPLQSIWDDILPVVSWSDEGLGFETQKPEGLLERILLASSNEGQLVGDFFAGSGTTGAVADRLRRRWIMSDFSKVAIQVARTRLVHQDAHPFVVENIGNYQRELIYALGARISEMQRIILKLFGATPHPSYQDLGIRSPEGGDERTLVFAGYPDRPVTAKKAIEMTRLAATLDGTGYRKLVILGWDYDYNFDAALESLGKKRIIVRHASDASRREFVYRMDDEVTIVIEPRIIPPSIYDYLKKAKSVEDVHGQITFHEKPYMRLASPKVRRVGGNESEVSLGLQRYVLSEIPLDDPEQVEQVRAVAKDNYAILIDYWAVDWDYDGATFRSRWQAFRGNGANRKTVPKTASTALTNGKEYRVMVRVVDVFGNDASAETAVNLPGEN